jgi:hypothetical protein
MEAKTPEQAPPDPELEAQKARAEKVLITGLQTQAQSDTASLMARFGTKLALASGGFSPATSSPDPLSALANTVKLPDFGKIFKTGA